MGGLSRSVESGERQGRSADVEGWWDRCVEFWAGVLGLGGGRRGSDLGGATVEDMGGDHGGRNVLGTGELLDGADVMTVFEEVGILGRARIIAPSAEPAIAAKLPGANRAERLFLVNVHGFDWNCPAHITPRYTEAEVEAYVAPLRARLQELEGRASKSP